MTFNSETTSMLRSVRLTIAFLFAFLILINFSFSYKPKKGLSKLVVYSAYNDSSSSSKKFVSEEPVKDKAPDTYTLLDLEKKGLSKTVFDLALQGYNKLIKKRLVRNKNIITVVDFSKPSNQKRLYVIDFKETKLCFSPWLHMGAIQVWNMQQIFPMKQIHTKAALAFT